MRLIESLLLAAANVFIRAWQWALSPFFGHCCRFHPSCSQYALQSMRTHGLRRGAWMGLKRIGRCNSLFEGGFDPVPEPRSSCGANR